MANTNLSPKQLSEKCKQKGLVWVADRPSHEMLAALEFYKVPNGKHLLSTLKKIPPELVESAKIILNLNLKLCNHNGVNSGGFAVCKHCKHQLGRFCTSKGSPDHSCYFNVEPDGSHIRLKNGTLFEINTIDIHKTGGVCLFCNRSKDHN